MGVAIGYLIVTLAILVVLFMVWVFLGPHPDGDPADRVRGFLRVGYALLGVAWGLTFENLVLGQAVSCLAVGLAGIGFILGALAGEVIGRLIRPFFGGDEED